MLKDPTIELALFPLSAHILPGGRMQLRIFERRYIRMVREACAGRMHFGICMLNNKGDQERNQHIYPISTMVEVIDFTVLEDGLLGITVEAGRCVRIESIRTEPDGLRIGQCRWVDEWKWDAQPQSIQPIGQKLREIFQRFPEMNNLHTDPRFDDPLWVLFRWLEMLPVDAGYKQSLLQEKDCRKILRFLTQLVD
ncbi:LON peptidase substrate-binding domain-containing protein [Bowmanella dokdonensis]|uniref:LON peptidase substrate-binding domain-containing protein n=1 Tax=Bowmanella dokdonensis TaxID=751969 RepID=A0A939ISE9_9ALTE|nr:LON peptidase substrate-binding domain-containing protein [Bowmanella dokdonensis]MBN7827114.1 LON peptidase substrate-binding domain-containing protein [Bowmanella dokdonensis]